jgi:hypothetical protein
MMRKELAFVVHVFVAMVGSTALGGSAHHCQPFVGQVKESVVRLPIQPAVVGISFSCRPAPESSNAQPFGKVGVAGGGVLANVVGTRRY